MYITKQSSFNTSGISQAVLSKLFSESREVSKPLDCML